MFDLLVIHVESDLPGSVVEVQGFSTDRIDFVPVLRLGQVSDPCNASERFPLLVSSSD